MTLIIDADRGQKVAELLHGAFNNKGILGHTDMPEDLIPDGIVKGSLEHILFVTLTVSIDYQRDADVLWGSSRKTYNDPLTMYLFDPKALHEKPRQSIIRDMQKYNLSKKPEKDADIWRSVGITFYKKWQGDPRNFLENCGWDAVKILQRLKEDQHLYNNYWKNDYPYLRGDKIGPLWLRMLRDNVGLKDMHNLDQVPIPVDIHVARATLALGIVRGRYDADLSVIYEAIRKAWFESVTGLIIEGRSMIALDVDEPLWHLSRFGCTDRNKITGECSNYNRCEAMNYCIFGSLEVSSNHVMLDT